MSIYEAEVRDLLSSKYAALVDETGLRAEERFNVGNLEQFFIGLLYESGVGWTKIDIDDYWDNEGIHVPGAGYNWLHIHSKTKQSYPIVSRDMVLPSVTDLVVDAGGEARWGLEAGRHAAGTHFLIFVGNPYVPGIDKDAVWFQAYHSPATADTKRNIEITDLLPTDYGSAYHNYWIEGNRGTKFLYVDSELIAVFVTGVEDNLPKWENSEPYALTSFPMEGEEYYYKYEINADKEFTWEAPSIGESGEGLKDPPSGATPCMGWFAGDPHPPKTLKLYNENTSTKWEGLATGGAVQTSHPIPTNGYPRKTLYFQSDAAGTLDIEVYAGGGWRVYDSPTISANELEVYEFPQESQFPIMRCVYTPTDDDTIAYGEVDLA